jgi:hypothetical protein
MRFHKKIFLIVFLGFLLLQPAFSLKMGKRIKPVPNLGYVGQLVYVDGDVRVQRVKAANWLVGYDNMPNYLFDHIKTGDHSKTTLQFKDGTQVGINPDTEVFIDTDKSVKDVTKRTLFKRVLLTLGTIWCKVTKQKSNESFVVETPGGILGVHGTQFVVSTNGSQQTEVYVLEGSVMAGPSLNELTQAIPEGEEATLEKGKIIREIYQGSGIAHIVSTAFGAPWYAHWGIDLGTEILTGATVQQVAIDVAEDAVANYVPYGGYAVGITRILGFGGSPAPSPHPQNLQPQGDVATYTPTFSWSGIPQAKQYMLMISRTPFQKKMPKEDFVWIARVDKNFVVYPYSAPMLSPGTQYYWTVVGLDENGKVVGQAAMPVSFMMAPPNVLGTPNFYPVPEAPINVSVSTPLPQFSWKAMNGAAKYAVLVGSELKGNQLDPDFSMATLITSDTNVSYTLQNEPLEPGHTYYWSVVALDASGNAFSQPSPPSAFTLLSAEELGPTPVFPTGEISAKDDLHLEWRSWLTGVAGYKVVIAENSNLSHPVWLETTQTPWLDIPNLKSKFVPGKKYYWAVRYIGLHGEALRNASLVVSFSIKP